MNIHGLKLRRKSIVVRLRKAKASKNRHMINTLHEARGEVDRKIKALRLKRKKKK